MPEKKLPPREGKKGRFVTPEYAEQHKAETQVQTVYLSEAKYKEAKEMMNKLGEKSKAIMGLCREETAQFELLLWLIGDGDKPEIE